MSFVGDIVGDLIGADASRTASNIQADATKAGIKEQRRQFDLTREDFAPYRAAGVTALQQLVNENRRLPTAAEVMSDPGYQFGLSQGQTAIDRRIAAMGGRVSGAAIKAAGQFATNYATTGYGASYQRRQDRLNRLATIAGVAQTATGTGAALGQNSTNAVTQLLSNQGDAAAAGRLQRGNIWGNAANRLIATYGPRSGNSLQAAFSQTGLGSSGFGSGMAYGNEDLGQYFG